MAVPFHADVAGFFIYFEGRDFPLLFFSLGVNSPALLVSVLSPTSLLPSWTWRLTSLLSGFCSRSYRVFLLCIQILPWRFLRSSTVCLPFVLPILVILSHPLSSSLFLFFTISSSHFPSPPLKREEGSLSPRSTWLSQQYQHEKERPF